MPLLVGDGVYWKEADPGFNMFNWGHMFRYEFATGEVSPVSVWPQEYVNYPSAGARFLAWRGADAFKFGVYDMIRGQARLIADSTGDAATKRMISLIDVQHDIGKADLCLFRAKEAQREQGEETGRVTLREDLGRS